MTTNTKHSYTECMMVSLQAGTALGVLIANPSGKSDEDVAKEVDDVIRSVEKVYDDCFKDVNSSEFFSLKLEGFLQNVIDNNKSQ